MKGFSEVSIPLDESAMTSSERRLMVLNAQREQLVSAGKKETIAQQREYEELLRENLISDLKELSEAERLEQNSYSADPHHVRILDALIEAGNLSKEALNNHPILLEETKKIALKRLASLRDSNERLALLEGALCMPDDRCEELQAIRDRELRNLEKAWGVKEWN